MPLAENRRTETAFDLDGEAATAELAGRLAPLAGPGDVIGLWGGLGTGKTVFARAFIRARGNPDEEVPSPTFTLVQVYDPAAGFSGSVYHFDLYRLSAPEDAYELDIEDAFADGISLIEWPERLGPLLPAERLDVTLAHGPSPEARHLSLSGDEDWQARLLEAGLV